VEGAAVVWSCRPAAVEAYAEDLAAQMAGLQLGGGQLSASGFSGFSGCAISAIRLRSWRAGVAHLAQGNLT